MKARQFLRVHGEWFKPVEPLLELIESSPTADFNFDVELINHKKKVNAQIQKSRKSRKRKIDERRKRFGKNVNSLIEANGLSRVDFSLKIGISPATVSDLISGKITPRPRTMRKIANLFDISVESITQ